MLDKHYIKAIFTPDKTKTGTGGSQPDPDNAVAVTIVAFTDDALNAIFIDEKGNLKSGYLRQFSCCLFMTL